MKTLFIVTDLYDLNNSRMLIDYLSTRCDVHVLFLTTPLKPYREIFKKYRSKLADRVEMPVPVNKHVGDTDYLKKVLKNKFDFTFINCSYFNQFISIDVFDSRNNMGKLYGLSWGFDGTSCADVYNFLDKVFCEGPIFFGYNKWFLETFKEKIHFSHPYYDVFNRYCVDSCRKKLGINTSKSVILLVETGNILNIESKWKNLYLEVLDKINRDDNYVVFKARSKLPINPCRKFMKNVVDLYIEDEWIYPPCSAVASIASDYVILPCESKYVLESVCAKKPTILYTKGKHKGRGSTKMFDLIYHLFKFEKFGTVNHKISPAYVQYNYNALNNIVQFKKEGNCSYIYNIMLNEK